MHNTARIAAALALVPLFVTIPAQALSVKEWSEKSNNDQLLYVSGCLARLVVAVKKYDEPLAEKIRSYYGDKRTGQQYPQGMYDLFTAIASLERRAETDSSVDLSKIEIEDFILRTTAQKLGSPGITADALRNFGAGTVTRKAPPAQPAGANATTPIMVGKIDVSHFAGVKPRDTRQQVVSIYGQPADDQRTSQWWGNTHSPFTVSYVDGKAQTVELYSGAVSFVRTHGGNDALVDLIGQKDPAAVALLGPPTSEEDDLVDGTLYNLFWAFRMNGQRESEFADLATDQTLGLRFKRINPPRRIHGIRQNDADCVWVSVSWKLR